MNKQQLEEILNNAPEGEIKVRHVGVHFNSIIYANFEEHSTPLIYRKGRWVSGCNLQLNFIHSISDLQIQLDQLNEIERLKSQLIEIHSEAKMKRTNSQHKEVRNGTALSGEPLHYEVPLHLINRISKDLTNETIRRK